MSAHCEIEQLADEAFTFFEKTWSQPEKPIPIEIWHHAFRRGVESALPAFIEQATRIAELEQQLADANRAARYETDVAAQAIADLEPYRKDATRYQWLTSREADGRLVPAGKAREMVYKVWNLLMDVQDEKPSKGKIDAAIDSAIQGEKQ